jgi:ATP-dependent helicase/nuclease subunit A
VFDKKTGCMRKARYGDIAILLRATKGYADSFVSELSNRGIPAFADINSGYFENMEVQVIMALLKIIDNPYQDIPLVAVLRSKIGDFDANELTDIRLVDKNCSFYEALQKSAGQGNRKALDFLEQLSKWRDMSKYLRLGELIWNLYEETSYYDYVSIMPNGDVRKANLDALLQKAEKFDSSSYKGLFNFIKFIDNLQEASGDMSSSKLIGDTENVVRIMSIHKSKGLEFPIVFLCGASRRFNRRDESNQIIFGVIKSLIDAEEEIYQFKIKMNSFQGFSIFECWELLKNKYENLINRTDIKHFLIENGVTIINDEMEFLMDYIKIITKSKGDLNFNDLVRLVNPHNPELIF